MGYNWVMFKKAFVVLDLETSGIDPKVNDIIEVALIRYEKGHEVARMDSLVKIDYVLPRIITAITGITDEEIQKKGRPLAEVMGEAEELLRDAYLVGHNIKFDVGFLKAQKAKLETLGFIDTVQLAQIVFPESASFSLESLTADLGIEHTARHRAMGDVEATRDLFLRIIHEIEALSEDLLSEIRGHLARAAWEGSVVFDLPSFPRRRESRPKAKSADSRLRGNDKHGHGNDTSAVPPKPLDPEVMLGEGGMATRVLEGYEFRPQQLEMARQIKNAFGQGYHLICEAPTGVGKSLAYLAVAAETALANKSKIVISTNTLNLQSQLYEKDLPLLAKIYQEATGHPGIRPALLKGRSHYLCLRRLAEFKRRPRYSDIEALLLTKILVWQAITLTGDSAEIHLTREETLIWDFELCSDQKYCSPSKCKSFGECYLHKAREIAEAADIIIVNHALLCADLESGGGLLPEYQYLVIDEAHHFEEAATDAFGVEVTQESVSLPIKLIRNHLEDFHRRHPEVPFSSLEPVLAAIPDLEQRIDNFFSVVALFVNRNVPNSGYVESLLVDRAVLGMPDWLNLESSMQEVGEKVREWLKSLRPLAEQANLPESTTDELKQEMETIEEQLGNLKTFFGGEDAGASIRWMSASLSGVVSLHLAPLLVGSRLKEALYDQKKSVILTSATLSVSAGEEGKPFTYLRNMLSLDDRFEEVKLDSPFDFEAQAYALIPTDMLPLTAPQSRAQVSDFFASLIQNLRGGILGLFTAYSAIETLYLELMNRPEVQGTRLIGQRVSGGRNKVMKAYLQDPTHSVLLGTSSFWEGIDIRGEALTALVIHKLPFDVPSEPIFKARQELFSNSFMEYSVPRAILRFKQGFGRLIRSRKDFGALVVLDNRVTTKDFGKLFLDALPKGIVIEKMKLMDIPGKVREWLELSRKP